MFFKVLGSVFEMADLSHSSSVNWEPCSTPWGKCFACSQSLMLRNKRETQEKQMENWSPLLIGLNPEVTVYWRHCVEKKKKLFYDAWVFQVLNDFISESRNISRWSIVKALIRNQLKICSKLHFVNMTYKHLPVWNRADVIPYLKITGIVVNPNLGSGEVFTLEKLELG